MSRMNNIEATICKNNSLLSFVVQYFKQFNNVCNHFFYNLINGKYITSFSYSMTKLYCPAGKRLISASSELVSDLGISSKRFMLYLPKLSLMSIFNRDLSEINSGSNSYSSVTLSEAGLGNKSSFQKIERIGGAQQ
jgi:hypothetical protein